MSGDNFTTPFEFVSVLLTSERHGVEVELANNVTDIEMHEHIATPFLHAHIVLIDNNRLLERLDLLGGEKISVTLRSMKHEDALEFTNEFRVVRARGIKGNDASQAVVINCIEEHGYISNATNVNQVYKQKKASEIIGKLAKDYLGKDIDGEGNDRDAFSVVVPNMSPLQAIQWIRDGAMTEQGYPMFVWSSPYSNKLLMSDLGTMLSGNVGNSLPYTASTAQTARGLSTSASRSIKVYSFEGSKSIYDLISAAQVGSKYNIIDLSEEEYKSFDWNIVQDMILPFSNDGVYNSQENNRFIYAPQLANNGDLLHESTTDEKHYLGGTNPWRTSDDTETFDLGYKERRNKADYKLYQTSRIMQDVASLQTLNMTIDGIDFMKGTGQTTVGNLINVEFPRNTDEIMPGDSPVDESKSGTYFILAARHMFKREVYDIGLQTGRMAKR